MGWHRLHNAAQDQPRYYYVAYGEGGPGDGERLHRHTVGQTFTGLSGFAQVIVDGVSYPLGPGQSVYAPPNSEHGLLVLKPHTRYLSVFFEFDGPINWDRIRQEQVPGLSPVEIAERAGHITGGGG